MTKQELINQIDAAGALQLSSFELGKLRYLNWQYAVYVTPNNKHMYSALTPMQNIINCGLVEVYHQGEFICRLKDGEFVEGEE